MTIGHSQSVIVARSPVVGQGSTEPGSVFIVKNAHARSYHIMRIVYHERMKQCAFVAEEKLVVQNPALVVVGKINVVKVDPTPGLEARQDLKDQPVDLAAGLHGVRRVDEEEPALSQIRQRL